MQYWLTTWDYTTWQQRDAAVLCWPADTQWGRTLHQELRPGDRIVGYLAKVGHIGVWEATSTARTDPAASPYGAAYPVVVDVTPLLVLTPETAHPVSDLPADSPLRHMGTGHGHPELYQTTGRRLDPGRGRALEQLLHTWAQEPKRTTLTDRQTRPAAGRVGREWIAALRQVVASDTRLSVTEAVRRLADQGLQGTGSEDDADALIRAISIVPGTGFTLDGRTIVCDPNSAGLATPTINGADDAVAEDDQGFAAAQAAILTHRQAVKAALVEQMHELDPDRFERLVAVLLEKLGVEQAEVVGRSHDGGVDVRGVLRSAEVITRPIVVQVKRYRGNIGAPAVRELRGSLSHDRGELGLFVTLSDFTRPARDEAVTDRVPVSLMNGDELTNALIKHQIGVKRENAALLRVTGFQALLPTVDGL